MGLHAVAYPIGMTQKQDGGSNQCISALDGNFVTGEQMLASKSTYKAAYICCPSLYSSTKCV